MPSIVCSLAATFTQLTGLIGLAKPRTAMKGAAICWQVPKHVTEVDLRPLFEPYGEIMCLNVLRTQRGQGPSAGCAFVEVVHHPAVSQHPVIAYFLKLPVCVATFSIGRAVEEAPDCT